jgi:hypothetical protein
MPLWDFALFENGQARSMSEIGIYRQLGLTAKRVLDCGGGRFFRTKLKLAVLQS